MGKKSRARSRAGLPGALDETDALPDEYNPDFAYGGGGAYDIEGGFQAPPPEAREKPEQVYKPGNNCRNEAWAGKERDPQFRAMDLMNEKAMAARGRGGLVRHGDEDDDPDGSKWKMARK